MKTLTELKSKIVDLTITTEDAREQLTEIARTLVTAAVESQNQNSDIDFQGILSLINITLDDESGDVEEFVLSILDENSAFNIEVIYYSIAIDYLSKEDPSLKASLELAGELGYAVEDISSELLASLLQSQEERENYSLDLSEIWAEIEEIRELIEEIENEIEEIRNFNFLNDTYLMNDGRYITFDDDKYKLESENEVITFDDIDELIEELEKC